MECYPYPVKEGQRYINLNPGRLFVQQPPKRERDRETHLNYYTSAYNRERQLSHRKTKLNQILQNTRINQQQQQYFVDFYYDYGNMLQYNLPSASTTLPRT